MNNHKNWINNKIRWGWFFVLLGIIFFGVGIIVEITFGLSPL